MAGRGVSIVKIIVYLVVLGSLSFLGLCVTFAWIPRSLAVQPMPAEVDHQPVDLVKRMQAAIDDEYTVKITESELNEYLKQKVQLGHSSLVAEFVTITGIMAKLEEGSIDVTIEREFDLPGNMREDGSRRVPALPYTHTCSMTFKLYQDAGADGVMKSVVEFPGGHLGQAQLPGLLVSIVKPSFDVLAEALAEEIELGFHNMTSVTVREGVIELDPRLPDVAQPSF